MTEFGNKRLKRAVSCRLSAGKVAGKQERGGFPFAPEKM